MLLLEPGGIYRGSLLSQLCGVCPAIPSDGVGGLARCRIG